jgi:tetratricopeptide (TPR) repeat protein
MLWGLGTSERALARAGEAERLARELSHPNTLANAMTFAAYLYWFCGEADAALEKVRAVEELGRTYGLAAYLPIATVLAGRIAVHGGRRADGLAAALGALPALRGWRHTIAVSLVAESCAETGEFAKGLEVLAEGLATAERDGMGIHLSELHRLRGELLARASSTPTPEAIASLRRALELAQRQQARSLELRAATSLARLLAPQGRRDEARETLSQVYRAFTEGLDTRDLVAAREVLDALR